MNKLEYVSSPKFIQIIKTPISQHMRGQNALKVTHPGNPRDAYVHCLTKKALVLGSLSIKVQSV